MVAVGSVLQYLLLTFSVFPFDFLPLLSPVFLAGPIDAPIDALCTIAVRTVDNLHLMCWPYVG